MLPLHFWDIVNRGRFEKTEKEDEVSIIVQAIAKEEPSRIIKFIQIHDELYSKLYKHLRQNTGLIYKLGLSDDGFRDFISWILLQGQEFYNQVLSDEIEFNQNNFGMSESFGCFHLLVHEEYWVNQGVDPNIIMDINGDEDDPRSFDNWYAQYSK